MLMTGRAVTIRRSGGARKKRICSKSNVLYNFECDEKETCPESTYDGQSSKNLYTRTRTQGHNYKYKKKHQDSFLHLHQEKAKEDKRSCKAEFIGLPTFSREFPATCDWLAESFLNPDWFRKLARHILVTARLSRQLTSSLYYSVGKSTQWWRRGLQVVSHKVLW